MLSEIIKEAIITARIAIKIPIGILRYLETHPYIPLLATITATTIALTTLLYTKGNRKTKKIVPIIATTIILLSAIGMNGFNARYTDSETSQGNTFTSDIEFEEPTPTIQEQENNQTQEGTEWK